jgi:uncharacterized protein (TIGR03083 family)
MTQLQPVLTLHLFPDERRALLDLLSALDAAHWAAPTVCPGWSVKDIAAHLVGDDLGRLSGGRDHYSSGGLQWTGQGDFSKTLLLWVNEANERWVVAARRLSPRLLIDLLRWSGEETQRYFETLDMDEIGEPVTWAGPEPAPVWLDIAREYTERWLHQAQIRDATGQPSLTEPHLFAPVLDTFVRALPHAFRETDVPTGTHVLLRITGVGGQGFPPLQWSLLREDARWSLLDSAEKEPVTTITLDADTAWRLFTRGLAKSEARGRAHITGERRLGDKVLDTVSIIA